MSDECGVVQCERRPRRFIRNYPMKSCGYRMLSTGITTRMFSVCSSYATETQRRSHTPRTLPLVLSLRRGARAATSRRVTRVIYRRGELSKAAIDRNWPHQVALRAEHCSGHDYVTIRLFCEGLSLCPRGHFFRRDNADMNVFCFAEREHAERFRERFGGEFISPKERPKWPGS